MPTGTVKWYDTEKGFGFIASDDGEDVFVHVSTLPDGVTALKQGTKVEFGIVDGRRGKQALSVSLIGPVPSVVKGSRKPAGDLAGIIEDVFVFCLPGSNGAVKDGWSVIGPQLDSRHAPCNLVEIMPRLLER